jgi:predicted  nucleic acid-binding Zn-ribbon protein
MTRLIAGLFTAILLAAVPASSPALAQDIRGLEVCTAEKSMDRRTSCLQANTQFLQQALTKLTREQQTANRELAAARAEVAALKSALAKLEHELALLKPKPAPGKK